MKITFPADFKWTDAQRHDEKLTLSIYPWDTSPAAAILPVRPALGFPIGYEGGKLTANVPADLKLPNTSAVFAVHYSFTQELPGVPDLKFQSMVCRTGLVRVTNGLPSELLVLKLPEPQQVSLSEMSTYLKSGGNVWFGMVPRQNPIEVKDGLIVVYLYLTGFIGNLSGNIRLYLSLKPAQVPDPGRYLALELEKSEGVGLDKGALEKTVRNQFLPDIRKIIDGSVKDAIHENISPLDSIAELYSQDRAITSGRGVLLNNFKLGMTVASSAFVTYPIA